MSEINIQITGGSAATSSTLISWLQNNGTITQYVNVYLNNTLTEVTIAGENKWANASISGHTLTFPAYDTTFIDGRELFSTSGGTQHSVSGQDSIEENGYYVYDDSTWLDLTTLGLAVGTHKITAKATAVDFRDSNFSNEVSYTVVSSGPNIGDIITLNGETRRYRVIGKVGNNYKLLDMDNTDTSAFNSSSATTTFSNGQVGQRYQGSTLDMAMTTYYNNLSTVIKNAIVDTNINQNMYKYYDKPNTKGDTTYTYQYQYNWSDSNWENANYEGYVNVGNRKCFALDLPDIYEYMAVKGADGNRLASSSDLMKMFFGGTGAQGGYNQVVWLRSARADDSVRAWHVYGNFGRLSGSLYGDDFVVRPAFVINLSGITWSVAN